MSNEKKIDPTRQISFGIPSNERLMKPALDLLRSAELPIKHRARNYMGIGERWDRLNVFFIRVRDIARFIAAGTLDAGIVTEEILEEHNLNVRVVCPLDFSFSKVIIASHRIHKIEDLAYKAIATSFPIITKNFIEKHKIPGVRIIKTEGTVEVFPALGLCDAIVDLMETGYTLKENGLHIIAEIRQQQAILIAKQPFDDKKELDLEFIRGSLTGAIKAKKLRLMHCIFDYSAEQLKIFNAVMTKYQTGIEKLNHLGSGHFELFVSIDVVSRIMRVLHEKVSGIDITLYPIGLFFGKKHESY